MVTLVFGAMLVVVLSILELIRVINTKELEKEIDQEFDEIVESLAKYFPDRAEKLKACYKKRSHVDVK